MAAHDPIKVGSASLTDFVPQPGAQITTNEFGTDSCDLVYYVSDFSAAAALRPAQGSAYGGGSSLPLSGFYVHDASVRLLEGRTAELTVQYKKKNTARVPLVTAGSDLKVSNIVSTAVSALSAFGASGFPEPTVSVKYCSSTAPSFSSILAVTKALDAASIAGFPTLADITQPFTINAPGFTENGNPIPVGARYEFYWKPSPYWKNTKLEYTTLCGGIFYEVSEGWRNFYYYVGFRAIA